MKNCPGLKIVKYQAQKFKEKKETRGCLFESPTKSEDEPN